MILRQFLHKDPIGISYLFGCVGQASAAVVDPANDVDFYIKAATETGVRICYVIDTHIHADHVSAGKRLAEATGAEYILSSKAEVSFSFKAVNDKDILQLGNVSIEIWHTPGHTPEHLSLIVRDHTRSEDPWFVATGHTLMVGDLGRTELATSAEAGAKDLYKSINRLKTLPDYIEIMPGAYAGSVCGRRLSGKPFSTIGFEKRNNQAFKINDEAEFIQFMINETPPEPDGAAKLRAINSGLTK